MGKFLRNRKIVINCDNAASRQVLNSGFDRDPFLKSCLREICFYATLHEFQLKAKFLFGTENRRPDWLSRWDLKPYYKSWFYESVKNQTVEEYRVDNSLFRVTHTWWNSSREPNIRLNLHPHSFLPCSAQIYCSNWLLFFRYC